MPDPKCCTCCDCGYAEPEETTCPKRKDETHCNHWWDWCADPACETCPKERLDMPKNPVYEDGARIVRRVAEKAPTKGGAHAFYEVVDPTKWVKGLTEAEDDNEVIGTLDFQHDTIPAVGVQGWTIEAVLAVAIDRLEGFQAGEFACASNQEALEHCRAALARLEARTAERKARGVEGKHEA